MAINKKIADLQEMFSVFDNAIDKYSQLIELGKNNTGIPIKNKNESNRISGCASMAWISTSKKNNFPQ